MKMDLKELQKMIDEEPQPAAPETVEEVVKMEQSETEEKQTTTAPVTPAVDPQRVSVAQFGAVVTSIYCGLSDAVYKRVKNCRTAPAWEPETRKAISEAAAAALSNYNVPMSPAWQLVITLATVEVMRYTLLKPE